ncbi:MAG: alkaline phosphatase family protein [bacterium]
MKKLHEQRARYKKFTTCLLVAYTFISCPFAKPTLTAPQANTSATNLDSSEPNCVIKPPKLTIIMIGDQFAYDYIRKLRKHFKYGLKKLLDNGICYENAYHAHGLPSTAPGHVALSTGTLPKNHSIIANKWLNKDREEISFNTPEQVMVDGLSDQCVMSSTPESQCHVISLSLKKRSAMATANKLGKALWFKGESGGFQSNEYYFKTLPEWVKKLNRENNKNSAQEVIWRTFYPENSIEYIFPLIKNYDYAALKHKLINFPIILGQKSERKDKKHKNNTHINNSNKSYDNGALPSTGKELFTMTPFASQLLFQAAQKCIDKTLKNKPNDSLVLWVCISNLDMIGHLYGPDSQEAIDLIYHLDKQIDDFMNIVLTKFDAKDVLFALTADHGVQPIQEITKLKGLDQAYRIDAQALIKAMNVRITQKYRINNLVQKFSNVYFVLDHAKLNKLNKKTRKSILHDLKQYLLNQPGIRHVWTKKELEKAHFEPYEKETYYKNQLYNDKPGDLIYMPQPYSLITEYKTGTSHRTPYDYDTHVPLILYGHNLKHKIIRKRVLAAQLPVTLAHLLGVAHPSASNLTILPGVC